MVTLKEYLNSDRIDYFPFGSKGYIMDWLLRTEQYWIRRYIRALRKEESFGYPSWVLYKCRLF